MRHLTTDGWMAASLVLAAVVGAVCWSGGRAYQRAVDAWWRFRNHVRSTGYMFRTARRATSDAVATLALAGLVVIALIATGWMLYEGKS